MIKLEFHNIEYLYLLVIIPILIVLYFWKLRHQTPKITLTTTSFIKQFAKQSILSKLQHLPFLLIMISLGLVIIAIARPQSQSTRKEINTEGVDIVLAVDVSTSMLAEDIKPNRIDAAKESAKQFVKKRINDRIGLVLFSGESFTQSPITIDHSILLTLIDKIKTGMIEDGTAIGMGLSTAVARLKDSKSKSKVIILLTDGVNNTGIISPLTATEISKTYGIKVYTIGLGTMGQAPYPVKTPFGTQYQYVDVKIDEPLLKNIAQQTGGEFYRATNRKALESIYDKIDNLEKTKIEVAYFTKKNELYFAYTMWATIILVASLILKYSIFRKLP
jgi:Ca-activated chloride channel family protein